MTSVVKPPDDIDDVLPIDTCMVFWGSHGCHRPKGHEPADAHWCVCCECEDHPDDGDVLCVAGPPYYGPDTEFY